MVARRELAAAVGAALTVVGLYALVRLQMSPDFGRYVGHGLGLYPSPIGRLAGAGGPWTLVGLNAVGAAAIAYKLAGRSPGYLRVAIAIPVLVWALPAGVDAAGAAAALYALDDRRQTRTIAGTIAAVLIHPAAAIAPVAELLRRGTLFVVYPLLAAGGALLLTPYRALLLPAHVSVGAIAAAGATFAIGAAALGWQRRGILLAGAVALAVGSVAAHDHGVGVEYLRYSLPLVAYGLCL